VGLLAVADFGLGVFAAIRDGVFTWDALAAWLRKSLVGRVLPIFGALFIGHLAGGLTVDDGVMGVLTPGTIITGIGLVAATAYVLEVIASIRESFVKKPETRAVPTE
jgi:hypothetical protein